MVNVAPRARSSFFSPEPQPARTASATSRRAVAWPEYFPLTMRIGVLTGGGDCPGLNAVIRAIVRKGIDRYGHSILGFRDGWRGPIESFYDELTVESTRGILPRGGTILGSSRTNPLKHEGGLARIRDNLASLDVDGLIAIGGEDTLGAAARLHEEGLRVVGVPKTIDNDLGATDMTFGFNTAVQVATDAIDRLHTTAESHHRNLVVEVMGRNAGWIALYSGMAGGADVILIPERPFDIEEVCRHIRRRHDRGRFFSIVVVAEGALPAEGTMETLGGATDEEFGHVRLGGIGQRLEGEIEKRTGFETRTTVLGHIQRGGTPTAFDRVLATRFGMNAIDAATKEKWGMMVALHAMEIQLVPIRQAVEELRTVPAAEYEAAAAFFG